MPEQVDQIINKIVGTEGVATEITKNVEKYSDQQFYCDAKNQTNLNDFIDTEKPKLVALVGFVGVGKSTFIGSLYQQLIMNLDYYGYAFIDSDTYVGFERRVFLRRVNDDNTSGTKRNILGENDILHIKLKSNKGPKYHILVSDKAGETYQKYLSSDEAVEGDLVLKNAELIIFFIDGDADSSGLAKHNLIIDNYSSMLTRLKEQKKIGETSNYIIVFTKIDKVTNDERKVKLAAREKEIVALFEEKIGVAAEQIYKVNSTDLNDKALNEVFALLLAPIVSTDAPKGLDWAKIEIETVI